MFSAICFNLDQSKILSFRKANCFGSSQPTRTSIVFIHALGTHFLREWHRHSYYLCDCIPSYVSDKKTFDRKKEKGTNKSMFGGTERHSAGKYQTKCKYRFIGQFTCFLLYTTFENMFF